MKNYVLYYWSRYGHNKKIVNHLSDKLKGNDVEIKVINTDDADPNNIPEADIYVFSAPAEAFNVQRSMRSFMKKIGGAEGKKYAIINTHAMNKNWLYKMDKILSKKNMVKIADVDFQIGKEGQKQAEGFIGDWEQKLDDFSKKLK